MLSYPSAEETASWPTPNYVNPVTRRPLVLGVEIPLICLVILFVSMRLYSKFAPELTWQLRLAYFILFVDNSRIAIVKAMGVDDYFMIAATVCFCANSVLMCVSTLPKFAIGYHLWDTPLAVASDSGPTGQIGLSTQLLFVPITAFTKVSILCTYLRIFPSDHNRWFCYAMLAFTTAWALSSFFVTLCQCIPIRAYWYPFNYPNVKCISPVALFYGTGFPNVTSDFLIFLWPAKDLAKIQISLKQRLTLIAMFSLGITICIAGVCRLWYSSIYARSYDILWCGATFYIVVSIETSIGIMCGCLPACRPFMSMLFPGIFSSAHSSSNKTKKSSKLDGQSFPFQSLSGGIMKSKEYSVTHEAAGEGSQPRSQGVSMAQTKSSRADPDNISSGSEEWIMEDPRANSVRAESTV